MKRLVAIIKPFKIDSVVEAIIGRTISPIAVTEVRGYGRQKGHLELYAGSEYQITFLPKVRLETIVDDSRVEEVVELILKHARTGRIGDGKIFLQAADEPDLVPR